MKNFSVFLLIIFCAGAINQTASAFTEYKWYGTADSSYTNTANWSSGLAAPYGVTNGNTRISVYNGTRNPLYYTAEQGHSVYTNTENRCLFIGSGVAGAMYITGGTFENKPSSMGNGLSYKADGLLVIDGGNYIQTAYTFLVKYGDVGTGTLTVSNGLFQAGELRFGNSSYSGSGVINFDGGTTRVSKILVNSSTGDSIINFNGGLIIPNYNEAYFLRNLTEANVLDGGILIDTNDKDITIDQDFQSCSETGGLTKSGNGRLTLGGISTFDGNVLIEEGTVRLTSGSALGSTNGTTTVIDGASLELGGGVTVTNETIIINGRPSSNWGALTAVLGDSTWGGNIVIGSDNSRISAYQESILRIDGVIDDGAESYDVQFRGFGDGVTILNAVNTYGGDTEVVVATLRLGGDNRLPIGTRLLIGNSSNVDYATFDLNGFNQEVAILDDAGSTMTNSVIDSAGGGTLTVNDSGNRTFAGHFVGPLTLAKTNTNALTLNGDMQATSIAVNQGTLQGSATWHCLFNGTDTPNQMIVTEGTLDISSMTFDFDEGTAIEPGSYVVIDYSAGGTLTANATTPFFADVVDMPERGKLIHDTAAKQILFNYGLDGTILLVN